MGQSKGLGMGRWILLCDCGHQSAGRDPAEAVANAQAHALEEHGLVVPADVLLHDRSASDKGGTP